MRPVARSRMPVERTAAPVTARLPPVVPPTKRRFESVCIGGFLSSVRGLSQRPLSGGDDVANADRNAAEIQDRVSVIFTGRKQHILVANCLNIHILSGSSVD